ncbi:ribose 5-phosphate isomerase B [Komagataeibacter sp. AV436]|uniref:Ribose 5-phosphate isomerase B n=1 Tax=Komagataeibacter melomenusus TaxID=2766578 RepID=A0ABX2AD85_9PROT|nr:ribose 5-phosphate isomerase B [Komagataeibacter melomenusus]MBV1830988.1 ribose 5-phosphate isomerase B [Komagataeibacter melomenusus]NPC66238.1 ribose 5-phosphate isomerase B [Komagataeibacter melomenusus]
MDIAIGCDEAAFTLKETIRDFLEAEGHAITDYGTYDGAPVLYPDIAVTVAEAIKAGTHERGILLCGTGIGVAISANKVHGIRAAQTHDTYSAERAMKSNNAQIITLGARVIGPELAKTIVKAYLSSQFSGGPSAEKISRIAYYEERLPV